MEFFLTRLTVKLAIDPLETIEKIHDSATRALDTLRVHRNLNHSHSFFSM